ncbi:AraC family transcriptional regulator [Janibacter alittae]|uniref:AraC family transcriptional regulator n=1 Tax=Janibacter alittae TaxID=3115209 RepID=A0ABZ2MJF0_9MICO
MTGLLRHHNLIHTRDLYEAREEVSRAFCRHDLSLTSRTGRLDVVHNGVRVGGVGLNYLRYGDEVRISPGKLNAFYLVQVPIAGRAAVSVGDTTVMSDRNRASLVSPLQPVDMVWSDGCEQMIIYLDRRAVEQFASENAAGEHPKEVVFEPAVDTKAPAIRSWLRIVGLLRDEVESGSTLLESALASINFEQLLIGGLLAAQPNSSEYGIPISRGRVGNRAVKIVTDAITAQPERTWRVTELAALAGVSPRSLQGAFRREYGVGPMEVLRRARLEHAHSDLVAGSPEGTSVTEIAMSWGFFHLGRFAATYRERYRESPSNTLARK